MNLLSNDIRKSMGQHVWKWENMGFWYGQYKKLLVEMLGWHLDILFKVQERAFA